MLGWTVLNHLKQDPATRHIPVQMLTLDEDRQHGLARGAFSFVTKPTTPEGLERGSRPHQGIRRAAPQALAGRRRQSRRAAEHPRTARLRRHRRLRRSHRRARPSTAIEEQSFDCVVLDLRLPDMSGFDVLEQLRDTPVAQRSAGGRLHRQGTCRRRKTLGCTRWRAASW